MPDLTDLPKLSPITVGKDIQISFKKSEHYPLIIAVNGDEAFHYWVEKDGELVYDGNDFKCAPFEDN